MKKKTNRILPVFFICSALLLSISCSYMKTDLGNEDIDVSITRIKSSGKNGVILSFNTITSKLEIPSSVQGLPVLKIYFKKTTNLSSLTSITFEKPSSVAEIDTFKGASSLGSIVLPDSLTVMPTFQNCKALTEVTLSSKITEIPESCFEGCTALVSVSKQKKSDSESLEGIKIIGKKAFNGCTKLKSIALETSSITKIKEQTFYNCSVLTEVILPETIGSADEEDEQEKKSNNGSGSNTKSIGREAFALCSKLTKVEGFEKAVTLGEKIFDSCSNLSEVKIYDQIEEIPESMFSGCSALEKFNIPEKVKKIGNSAFSNTGLKELKCYPTTPPSITKPGLPEKPKETSAATESASTGTTDSTDTTNTTETETSSSIEINVYVPAASLALYEEEWGKVLDLTKVAIKALEE